jgi:hypothetical protein
MILSQFLPLHILTIYFPHPSSRQSTLHPPSYPHQWVFMPLFSSFIIFTRLDTSTFVYLCINHFHSLFISSFTTTILFLPTFWFLSLFLWHYVFFSDLYLFSVCHFRAFWLCPSFSPFTKVPLWLHLICFGSHHETTLVFSLHFYLYTESLCVRTMQLTSSGGHHYEIWQ